MSHKVSPQPRHVVPTRLPKSSYQWKPKKPQPSQVHHVSTSHHNSANNPIKQCGAKSSPTRHDPTRQGKAKWIPKLHIPLSAASQQQDGASTSLSVLSDLSTNVADTLKQHLSHFSIHDFWFSSVHESAT